MSDCTARSLALVPLLVLDQIETAVEAGAQPAEAIEAVLDRARRLALDALDQGRRYFREVPGTGPGADVRRATVYLASVAEAIDGARGGASHG